MKKFMKLLLVTSLLLTVSACSTKEKAKSEKKEESAQSSLVELSVEDGAYIVPMDKTTGDDVKYLSLNVKVTNKSDKKLEIAPDDFALYDEDGKKTSNEDIYSSDDQFKSMSYESLSEDKSLTEPIVFQVTKGKKYELHFKPTIFDLEDAEDESKEAGVELKIDQTKYKDETEEVEKLANHYIQTVFLGAEEKNDEKLELGNDLAKEKQAFKDSSINCLKNEFEYYEPSTPELEKVITEMQNTNRNKGKVTYKFNEFYPNFAAIYVRPEVVLFDNVDSKAIGEQFANENEGKYEEYDDALDRDIEKYFLQELPGKLGSSPINTDPDMDGEGYKINLEKKDGKWQVKSEKSSNNYNFASLTQTYRGGLYE
ncbi:DUF4352 domain-containing protein [Enterococcus gilvus]|uniref:DUF4352 domain-containing protein n=1 Tax=Enterococcus gilvus TaxID=160453 RepID=UPI001C8BF2FF|nr:DUF4352 domain-containing protein [Enterococcus gilvus]MBX8935565.1 DUF4352 domain-containing protein [Enterococcus gilvus]